MDFFDKAIPWLGKFHPAAVHFPIAMLVAASVAELLLLFTGRSAYEAVSRFCLSFGAAAALLAGILGWCCGGFQVVDRYWVLTAHRWLGTGSSVLLVLLLVFSKGSNHPGFGRTRMWFQGTLFLSTALVLLTGFFGGAMVHGLDYYAWPE